MKGEKRLNGRRRIARLDRVRDEFRRELCRRRDDRDVECKVVHVAERDRRRGSSATPDLESTDAAVVVIDGLPIGSGLVVIDVTAGMSFVRVGCQRGRGISAHAHARRRKDDEADRE